MAVSYKEFRKIKTWDDLYEFGATNGYEKSLELLSKYADEGEPSFFAKGMSNRDMSTCLSMGIEHIDKGNRGETSMEDTMYGLDLYNHLLGELV